MPTGYAVDIGAGKVDRMNKSHVLAGVAGCAIGFLGMALLYSQTFFRTCRNKDHKGGFWCSNCKSHTDYKATTPFNFCPMCGAYVIKERRI